LEVFHTRARTPYAAGGLNGYLGAAFKRFEPQIEADKQDAADKKPAIENTTVGERIQQRKTAPRRVAVQSLACFIVAPVGFSKP
jgi:hypothetical protein